jgi:hypothetical protein
MASKDCDKSVKWTTLAIVAYSRHVLNQDYVWKVRPHEAREVLEEISAIIGPPALCILLTKGLAGGASTEDERRTRILE